MNSACKSVVFLKSNSTEYSDGSYNGTLNNCIVYPDTAVSSGAN